MDLTRFQNFFHNPPPPLARNQERNTATLAWPGGGLVPKMQFHSLEFFLLSHCVSDDNFHTNTIELGKGNYNLPSGRFKHRFCPKKMAISWHLSRTKRSFLGVFSRNFFYLRALPSTAYSFESSTLTTGRRGFASDHPSPKNDRFWPSRSILWHFFEQKKGCFLMLVRVKHFLCGFCTI